MSAQVFVSHSSRDTAAAETILKALESRGLTCWMSGRDVNPGENFMSAIVRAIRGAKVMVLVFSESSNTSPEVAKELAVAAQHQVTVMPVRIADVTPGDAFAYALATSQWTDLFNDWSRGIDRLATSIVALVGVSGSPVAVPTRATADVQPPSSAPAPPPSNASAAPPDREAESSTAPRGIGITLVLLGVVRALFMLSAYSSAPPSYREVFFELNWLPALIDSATLAAGFMVWRGAAAARTVGLIVCGFGVLYELYVFSNILGRPGAVPAVTWLLFAGSGAVFAVSLYKMMKWRPSS
jgi:hypothetical protein